MSLSHYRDSITECLQKQIDLLAQQAIDMRVHPSMSSDTYALVQVDKLAQARAYADAARIVIAEYKRMTETPAQQDETQEKGDQPEKKEKPLYG